MLVVYFNFYSFFFCTSLDFINYESILMRIECDIA